MTLTQVVNRQEADDVYGLVTALADESCDGLGALRLSIRARLPRRRVESLLKKHFRYFVRIHSKHVYALNRLGRFCGSVPEIHQDIERAYAASRKRARLVVWSGLLTATVGIVLAGFFYASALFPGFAWLPGPIIMLTMGLAIASTGLRSA